MRPAQHTSTPRWWLTTAAVMGAVCGLDAVWTAGGVDAVAAAAGLGVTLGALLGLALDGLGAVGRRLPWPATLVGWLALGAGAGHWLAEGLGAWTRLDGPYRTLAILSLGLSYGGGAALGAVLWSQQPRRGAPALAMARPWLRWASVVALVAGAVVMTRVDRTRFVGIYPDAHVALQAVSLWALAAATRLLIGRPRVARRGLALAAVVVLGLSVGTFAALHGGAPVTLSALARRPLPDLALSTLRAWTDVDGDGVSSLLGGGDRAAFDPDIGAFEGTLEVDPTLGGTAQAVAEPSPVSVVLITVDTLRPDRMGVYGHSRNTTPRIGAWAQRATRFDRAYTSGSWTSLAVSSLMRGVYPRRLQWTRLAETTRFRLVRADEMTQLAEGERLKLMFGLPLEDPRPTLAERLKARGMYTMGVADDGYSSFLSREMGAARGFTDFLSVDSLPAKERTDAGTTKLALQALQKRPKDTPFFLWVHYFGPHSPSERYVRSWAYGRGVAEEYDHEVRYNDAHVGRLLTMLERIGKQTPLAIVLTSDHGELFLDRRRLHGVGLQEQLVRVPMLIQAPGLPTGPSSQLVSLVDLAPTILGLTRTPLDGVMDGEDLVGLLKAPPSPRVLLTETWRFNRHRKPVRDLVGAFDGTHMLVKDGVRNLKSVFSQRDLAVEQTDLHHQVKVPHLEAALQRYQAQTRGGRVDLRD